MVAFIGGDNTVGDKGYLTFNPLRYAHPFHSLFLPLLFAVLPLLSLLFTGARCGLCLSDAEVLGQLLALGRIGDNGQPPEILPHDIATVTINRPQVLNAFRAETVTEMIEAFQAAWADRTVGVVILTGAGDRAFCAGGDQSVRDAGGYQGTRARSDLGLDIEELHVVIRDIPKPVIAAVNGWAIGGGNVLQVICDLTIAAETA